MNKIKAIVAATALTAIPVSVGVAASSPAQAAGGNICHKAPDDGYDNDFIVRWNGFDSWISEGQCRSAVTMIYLPEGTEVKCSTNGPNGNYFIAWNTAGWHGVGNNFGAYCVNGLK